MVSKIKHRVMLGALAAAMFTLAVIGAMQTSSASFRQPATVARASAAMHASALTVTVGQTLSITDMQLPVTRSADAAEIPSDWSTRVNFKGCGQTVSLRTRVGKKILLYNTGTVTRYVRGTAGLPFAINGSHAIVPKDWREASFARPGKYTLTFTVATCTLWSPKIFVTVS